MHREYLAPLGTPQVLQSQGRMPLAKEGRRYKSGPTGQGLPPESIGAPRPQPTHTLGRPTLGESLLTTPVMGSHIRTVTTIDMSVMSRPSWSTAAQGHDRASRDESAS